MRGEKNVLTKQNNFPFTSYSLDADAGIQTINSYPILWKNNINWETLIVACWFRFHTKLELEFSQSLLSYVVSLSLSFSPPFFLIMITPSLEITENTTTETTRKSSEISTHSLDAVEKKNSGREKVFMNFAIQLRINTFKKKKNKSRKSCVVSSSQFSDHTIHLVELEIDAASNEKKAPLQYEPTRLKEKLWKIWKISSDSLEWRYLVTFL